MGRLHVLCRGAGAAARDQRDAEQDEIARDGMLAQIFSRPVGAPMYWIRRRRSIDGRAVLIESIIVDVAKLWIMEGSTQRPG